MRARIEGYSSISSEVERRGGRFDVFYQDISTYASMLKGFSISKKVFSSILTSCSRVILSVYLFWLKRYGPNYESLTRNYVQIVLSLVL